MEAQSQRRDLNDSASRLDRAPNVVLEDTNCPLGCARNDAFVLLGRDRLHDLPGEFNVVQCCGCGLLRTNPRPSPETIGVFYPDDYGPYLGTKIVEGESKSVLKQWLGPMVRKLFNDRSRSIPSLVPSQLLEFGCASGGFLHEMAGKGWKVQGIEFAEEPAAAARGLGYDVYVGSLESAPAPARPASLIVGWMVLEHLHDPVACLKKINTWAEPEARLVLSVPNANSFEFRIFKEQWYALQLPAHLYHFTPATLNKLLHAGGWKIDKIQHQRSLINVLASLAYALEDMGWLKTARLLLDFSMRGGITYYALFPFAWALSLFGQTGRMTVWASKAPQSAQSS